MILLFFFLCSVYKMTRALIYVRSSSQSTVISRGGEEKKENEETKKNE